MLDRREKTISISLLFSVVHTNYKPKRHYTSILYSPPLDERLDEGGVALACSQVKECHASEGLRVD